MSLKIGELSRLTGCPVVTIRFYEKEGLFAEPERTEGNYRIYNKTHLERLQFILNCRLLNMNLDEIQSLISFKMKPCGDCSSVNLLIDKHILQLEENIQKQMQLKQQLSNLRGKCSGSNDIDSCEVLKGLTKEILASN